jgi:hypothetical protein
MSKQQGEEITAHSVPSNVQKLPEPGENQSSFKHLTDPNIRTLEKSRFKYLIANWLLYRIAEGLEMEDESVLVCREG